MLTIKEIETIVQAFCTPVKSDVKLTELQGILLKQLFKQTNLDSIEEVQKVLSLYKSTKSKWLKKGLENVLLHGEFPVVIKEVSMGTTNTPSIIPMQPFVWPTKVPPSVPPVKFEPYCNYNDYKSESLTKVK